MKLATISFLFFCACSMAAENLPVIGMSRADVLSAFGQFVTDKLPRDGVVLRMPAYGYEADVQVAFDNGKVFSISAAFAGVHRLNQKVKAPAIFRDLRRVLEQLGGRDFSSVRIDGVDLVGLAPVRKEAKFVVVFGTTKDGILYQLEFTEGTSVRNDAGATVSLEIVSESSTSYPRSN